MPYDYYEILKKLRDPEEYTETSDIVRENIWNDSINFKISQEWLQIEEKIKIELYMYLRYS